MLFVPVAFVAATGGEAADQTAPANVGASVQQPTPVSRQPVWPQAPGLPFFPPAAYGGTVGYAGTPAAPPAYQPPKKKRRTGGNRWKRGGPTGSRFGCAIGGGPFGSGPNRGGAYGAKRWKPPKRSKRRSKRAQANPPQFSPAGMMPGAIPAWPPASAPMVGAQTAAPQAGSGNSPANTYYGFAPPPVYLAPPPTPYPWPTAATAPEKP